MHHIEGFAAALPEDNVNTDIIAPPGRGGASHDRYGPTDDGAARVFGPWRYREDGSEEPDFVLNKEPFRVAHFLVAGANFGCGSSRETAPKWLRAFGLRCIVAESFGGIFYDNCFRNGILPLAVGEPLHARLLDQAARSVRFGLDLDAMRLITDEGETLSIALPAFRLAMLRDGIAEIDTILAHADAITRYQAKARESRPWIWPPADANPR